MARPAEWRRGWEAAKSGSKGRRTAKPTNTEVGAAKFSGGNYRVEARSERAGWGTRGPASGVSAGALLRGFLQLTAHQREAYFGISHIFAQPAEVLACEQLQ
jgi:hypothetical protein